MLAKKSFLLLFTLLLLVSPGLARTEYNDTAGVSVTFPDSWQMEAEDDDMRLRQLQRSSVVLLTVVDTADYNQAYEDLGDEVDKWIEDANVTTEKEDSFNGLPAKLMEGTGTIDGAEARFVAVFFEYNNKVVMMVGVAKKEYWDPNVGDVLTILMSVKPDTK